MKTLAIAIIASFSIGSAFAQGAKQPEGIAKTAPAATAPAVTAPAPAKKEDKKEAKKADTKSEAAPAAKTEAPKK